MLRVLSVVVSDMERTSRVYPRRAGRKRAFLAAPPFLAAALLLAGCGGGGGDTTTAAAQQRVSAAGFSVAVPDGWTAVRQARAVTLTSGQGPELASAIELSLRKPYRPALFAKVAAELARTTATLANGLHGTVVASRVVVVAGARAHQYDLSYTRNGADLIERITYVLRGKSEWELLCRWAGPTPPAACSTLTESFRIR
jgi:hypothetical protein